MTQKRFKIVDEQFISYYGGTGHKISNGECGFWLWHDKTESQKVCDKLNSILDENEQLKSRVEYLERKINRERKSHFIQDEKWQTESTQQITKLKKENEKLKAQLYCDSEEGVCIICKHHYLEKGNIFYISKCEKGHEECSTDALKHCKDFEIKESKNE